jgi:hypothetical protein
MVLVVLQTTTLFAIQIALFTLEDAARNMVGVAMMMHIAAQAA